MPPLRRVPRRGRPPSPHGAVALVKRAGLKDAHRTMRLGPRAGYTRLSHTIHTRLDRIYHSTATDSFQWHKLGPSPDLFSGNAASDHLPLLAAFETPHYAQSRYYDPPIDSKIITEAGATKTVELLLNRAKERAKDNGNLADEWAQAKALIAAFLREETAARKTPAIQPTLEQRAESRRAQYPTHQERPGPKTHGAHSEGEPRAR